MSEIHRVMVILEARTTAYEAAVNRIGEKARSVERAIGIGVGAGIATAGVAAAGFVGYLAESVSKASALNEAINKTAATFGENTGEVMKFADGLSKMGANKKSVLDAASSFGLLAQGMGQSKDDARKLSMYFTKLAADTESFHNVDFDRVTQALRSGLAGEIPDTLKQMGVVLSEDTAKTEAVAQGWAKAGQKLTPMVNMMARANLIARGLAAAEGDLERTQDSWANTTRRLAAQLDNLSAKVGQELIPILTPFAVAISGAIDQLTDGFDEGNGYVNQFFDAIVEGSSLATAALKKPEDALTALTAKFNNYAKQTLMHGILNASGIGGLSEYATGKSPEDWLKFAMDKAATAQENTSGAGNIRRLYSQIFGNPEESGVAQEARRSLFAEQDAVREEIKRRRKEAKEDPTGPGINIPPLADIPEKAKHKGKGSGPEDILSFAYKLQTSALSESPEAKLLKQIEANTRPVKMRSDMGGFAVPEGTILG